MVDIYISLMRFLVILCILAVSLGLLKWCSNRQERPYPPESSGTQGQEKLTEVTAPDHGATPPGSKLRSELQRSQPLGLRGGKITQTTHPAGAIGTPEYHRRPGNSESAKHRLNELKAENIDLLISNSHILRRLDSGDGFLVYGGGFLKLDRKLLKISIMISENDSDDSFYSNCVAILDQSTSTAYTTSDKTLTIRVPEKANDVFLLQLGKEKLIEMIADDDSISKKMKMGGYVWGNYFEKDIVGKYSYRGKLRLTTWTGMVQKEGQFSSACLGLSDDYYKAVDD